MNRIINFFNLNKYPKENKNQFWFNFLLGIGILFFFILIKDTAVIQASINGWLDYYIMFRMNSDTDTHAVASNITFLDFDNKSFKMLNKPDLTPRDKVAYLLDIAYSGNAKVIVLDIDFSESDYSPTKKFADEDVPRNGLERDKILFDTIERIKNDSTSDTKIIIPLVNYADKTVKRNIFESLIDNKKIFAATPTLTTNQGGDNYARFWLPYLTVKDNETNEPKILWSIPLLAAVLYAGDFNDLENSRTEILNDNKNSFVTKINYKQNQQFTFYRESLQNSGIIRDTTAVQYNRIQYVAIPPDVLVQFPLGTIAPSNIGHWRKNGLDNTRIDCQDKIVIIGRADEDCSDFFTTPCGNLSGMYIHGNSIASILGETRPHLAPIYKYVLIEVLLIIITAYAFLGLREFQATCVVMILNLLCLVGTYIYFCYTNEFVYLSFCFMFLGIYNFVNDIQHAFIIGRFTINSGFRRLFRRR